MEKPGRIAFVVGTLALGLVIASPLWTLASPSNAIALFLLLWTFLPGGAALVMLFLGAYGKGLSKMTDNAFSLSFALLASVILLCMVLAVLSVAAGPGSGQSNPIAGKVQLPDGEWSLVGGITYFISNMFPVPVPASLGGIGGYGQYFTYLAYHVAYIGDLQLPEMAHVVIFAIAFMAIVLAVSWLTSLLGRKLIKDAPKFSARESTIAASFVIVGTALLGLSLAICLLLYMISQSGLLGRGKRHTISGK